ncbi:MAG: glutamyl-tRNA reductase [Acidimicrobiales bacterium]
MSVAVVGINHRTVPLEALEPLIVAPGDLHKALADLSSRSHLSEVVVLSTCMRTEVYAVVDRFHAAMADIREFLAAWSGRPPEEFSGNLYSYFDDGAVNHLFRVASGIDSASLGEPEVLAQVRHAWEAAAGEGAGGSVLAAAFGHALLVGKRARTETAISRGTTSLSYAAAQLAARTVGGLEGKQVLVIGAGGVGAGAARAFAAAPGAKPVLVANRSGARAKQVAAAVGGRPVPWHEVGRALGKADVVACCAAGELAPAGTGALADVLAHRPEHPVLLVDMAVPRSVDPAVSALPGARVLNMDDIAEFVAAQMDGRRAELPAVERIVAEELDRYNATLAARGVAPLVGALHSWAEEVRRAELGRLEGRLARLGGAERDVVELVTKRIVAKLLHEPTVNLKAAAGTARGEALAKAFGDLFGLGPY